MVLLVSHVMPVRVLMSSGVCDCARKNGSTGPGYGNLRLHQTTTTGDEFSVLLGNQKVFVLTKGSFLNCACLNSCVHCSRTFVGALMKLAANQIPLMLSVIKVREPCRPEFGQ